MSRLPASACMALIAAACATLCRDAAAQPASTGSGQAYPVKSIRLVLPYPPGGGTDLQARTLAQKLSENLGQTVVVDNRGGANGVLAMAHVAKSAADGYTLVYALPTQFAVNPALYPRLSYDPIRDFEPVSLVARTPLILLTHPSVPAKSMTELIRLAKAKRDDLVLASAGNGSAGHLCLELLKNMSGAQILHVPYKGAGPSLVDLLAGQAQLSFLAWSTARAFITSGKLRALGVTSEKRSPAIPGVPAIAETLRGYDILNWYAIATPKLVQKQILTKINMELSRALAAPDLRQAFEREAIEIVGSTPEFLRDFLHTELQKWGGLVKSSGLRID